MGSSVHKAEAAARRLARAGWRRHAGWTGVGASGGARKFRQPSDVLGVNSKFLLSIRRTEVYIERVIYRGRSALTNQFSGRGGVPPCKSICWGG